MANYPEWLLVKTEALPEIYRQVLAAKTDIAAGRVRSVSAATRLHGISRSAYYKYRDVVEPYVGKAAPAAVSVELLLQDCPGVLSGVLAAFSKAGASIVTINQDLPENGMARATLCARTENLSTPLNLFLEQVARVPGVQHVSGIRQKGEP